MIAVLSDIHGNYEALTAVLNNIRDETPLIKKIYILGDIIDYGANSVRCINELYSLVDNQEYVVKSAWGNHENYILKDMKSEITKTNERGKQSAEITKGELSQDITVLSKLVKLLSDTPDFQDDIFSFTHSYDDKYSSNYFCGNTLSSKILEVTDKDKILFVGHTHKPECIKLSDTWIINPGSVGQPRNEDNRAQYITCDITYVGNTKYLNINYKQVPYNIDLEAQAIVESKRNFYYASRLYLGI